MAVETLSLSQNYRLYSSQTQRLVFIFTLVFLCNVQGTYATTTQQPSSDIWTHEGAVEDDSLTKELATRGPFTIQPGDCLHDLFSKYSTNGRVDTSGFIELLKNLGLGEDVVIQPEHKDDGELSPDHHDHDHDHDHDHHDHEHKRAVGNETSPPNDGQLSSSDEPTTISKGSSGSVSSSGSSLDHGTHADHHHHDNYHVTECLSAEAVLDIFEEGTTVGLTEQQFLQVCPVLLQQLDSHVCVSINLKGGEGDLKQGGVNDRCHGATTTKESDMEDPTAPAVTGVHHVWGYAFAAVTLISMASIVCILVVPCMQRFPLIYGRLLSFLVAVAVGTLSGDAVMHLMPHAFGIHGHKEEVSESTIIPGCGDEVTTSGHHDDHGDENGDGIENNVVIKGLVVLIGIFSFFVIEQIMQLCQSCKQKRRKAESSGSTNYTQLNPGEEVGSKLCNHSGELADRLSRVPDSTAEAQLDSLIANDINQSTKKSSVVYSCHPERRDSQSSINSQHVTICVHSDAKIHIAPNPVPCDNNHGGGTGGEHHHKHEHNDFQHGSHDDHHHHGDHHQHGGSGGQVEKSTDEHHGHSHHGHSHTVPPANAGIATLAWIIVMGDGLHNFCDGLVVGAAFADSLAGGLSTAIAVMCHEVPHELGDFAVMLKAGMSIKQALAFQGLSSILAYIGMAIGVAMGNVSMVSLWIFALAAGMFLYIALADLFPEMVNTTLTTTDGKGCHLLLQIFGVTVGVGLMLTIGLLEEDLMAALSRGRGIS